MKKVQLSRRLAITVAVATAVAGGGAAAALATNQPTANIYQGCLNHHFGALYNIHVNPGSSPRCLHNDTLVSWNQTGPAGTPGSHGAKGDTGAAGSPGASGAPGPKGDTGTSGLTGPQGLKGDPGNSGQTGPPGAQGDTGAPGPQGAQGDTGASGPAGATGVAGVSGYEIVYGDQTINPAGHQTGATAGCSAGKVVLGGGESGNGGMEQSVHFSGPSADHSAWVAYMNNTGTTDDSFRVTAICAVIGP